MLGRSLQIPPDIPFIRVGSMSVYALKSAAPCRRLRSRAKNPDKILANSCQALKRSFTRPTSCRPPTAPHAHLTAYHCFSCLTVSRISCFRCFCMCSHFFFAGVICHTNRWYLAGPRWSASDPEVSGAPAVNVILRFHARNAKGKQN